MYTRNLMSSSSCPRRGLKNRTGYVYLCGSQCMPLVVGGYGDYAKKGCPKRWGKAPLNIKVTPSMMIGWQQGVFEVLSVQDQGANRAIKRCAILTSKPGHSSST